VLIHILDEKAGNGAYTVEELANQAPKHLDLSERVPGIEGQAFDVVSWYFAWRNLHGAQDMPEPTHMKVEAVDDFQAVLPWKQLGQSLFLYKQWGKPLEKGFPLRLYVPDGSSACLNVKSVVRISFLYDTAIGEEASYGYKNMVSIDELKKK